MKKRNEGATANVFFRVDERDSTFHVRRRRPTRRLKSNDLYFVWVLTEHNEGSWEWKWSLWQNSGLRKSYQGCGDSLCCQGNHILISIFLSCLRSELGGLALKCREFQPCQGKKKQQQQLDCGAFRLFSVCGAALNQAELLPVYISYSYLNDILWALEHGLLLPLTNWK